MVEGRARITFRSSAALRVAGWLTALLVLNVTAASATARAWGLPSIAPPDASATAPEAVDVPAIPLKTPYDALFDVAFQALYEGDLTAAEYAFRRAAALRGDPVRAAVAASFAERATQVRATRDMASEQKLAAAGPASPQPPIAPSATSAVGVPHTAFIATGALLGLGLYGWTVPATFGLVDGQDTGQFIGLYLLTASVSVVVPTLVGRAPPMTPAQANLAFYGGTRGAWHGALLSAALFGNLGPDRRYQLWAGSLLAGSVGELAGGYVFARPDLTAGEARTIAVGGDFGLGWGLAMGAILGLQHDNHSEDAQARGMAIAGLAGAVVGLGGGYLLAEQRDNSWGDGEVLRAAGLLGASLGLASDAWLGWEPDQSDQKKFYFTLIGGAAIGLFAGDRLVKDTEFSVGESVLVDMATLAGGLGGAGFVYLLKGDGGDPSTGAFFGSTALGGTLGFGLAYASLRQGARNREILEANIATRASTIAVLPLIGKKGEQGLSLAGTF